MTTQTRRTALALALMVMMVMVLGAGVGRAFAQETLVANIPFTFVVDGTTHHPGKYEFFVMNDGKAVEFESSGRRGEFVGVTSLTASEHGTGTGRLVFDTAKGTRYLTELWAPGRGGFLLYSLRDGHERQTVPLQWTPKTR